MLAHIMTVYPSDMASVASSVSSPWMSYVGLGRLHGAFFPKVAQHTRDYLLDLDFCEKCDCCHNHDQLIPERAWVPWVFSVPIGKENIYSSVGRGPFEAISSKKVISLLL